MLIDGDRHREVDVLYRYLSDFRDTDSDPDRHLTAGRVLVGAEGLGPAGAFSAKNAEVVEDHQGAVWPSDHFPVAIDFEFKSSASNR